MEKNVFSVDGKEAGKVNLNDYVFNCEVSEGSIYEAIKNELANLRQGTASTKSRGEVQGSGAKPWRQKGTGRARAGHKRSPIWRGGGIVFGPKPRDYSYVIPKKIKRLAIRSILSIKANDEQALKIVKNFNIESGKTKDFVKVLNNLSLTERNSRLTVILPSDDFALVKRAGRNVKNVSFLNYNRLRAHDLFYSKNVVFFEDSINKLNEFYGSN